MEPDEAQQGMPDQVPESRPDDFAHGFLAHLAIRGRRSALQGTCIICTMQYEICNGIVQAMIKSPFTMRFDDDIRALAEKVAQSEHRALSNLIEAAIIEYAERRGFRLRDKEGEEAP
jgi:hypothetical protein